MPSYPPHSTLTVVTGLPSLPDSREWLAEEREDACSLLRLSGRGGEGEEEKTALT